MLAFGLVLASGLALGLVVIVGDGGGQPLKAQFTFSPEGPNGFPQLAINFESSRLPERNSVETAFEVTPTLVGDFGWKDSTLIFSPSTRLLSNTDYQVRLRGGLKLVGGGRLDYQQASWTFHTRPARLAYLKKEGQGVNLWLKEGDATTARQLTFETARKVLDFSVSPGGERIVYSLEEPNSQEAGLWLIRVSDPGTSPGTEAERKEVPPPFKLVYEPKVRATAARWSPGGDLIAYERRLIFSGGAFGAAQLWLVKADGTSLPPLYGGYQQGGYDLEWAAGGDRAFFWEPRLEAVGIFNFTGEPKWKTLKGLIFAGLAPSPNGQEVIISRFDYSGVQEKEVLLRLSSIKGKTETDWQPNALQPPAVDGYNNRLPAWSPDGRLVAFIRQEMGPKLEKVSKIWIFDPQSGNAWPLIKSDEALKNVTHGTFTWSPDGQRILFERYEVVNRLKKEVTELWETNLDGKESHKLLTGGYSPKWIN